MSAPSVLEEQRDLEAALAAANAAGDANALAAIYTQAAFAREAAGEADAACFLLTHAYVFALSAGSPQAAPLFEALRLRGREAGDFLAP
jgi:hypothetical protein